MNITFDFLLCWLLSLGSESADQKVSSEGIYIHKIPTSNIEAISMLIYNRGYLGIKLCRCSLGYDIRVEVFALRGLCRLFGIRHIKYIMSKSG
jgi:hypothetical protein